MRVVVIGGGALGAACAGWLLRQADGTPLQVTVVEPDPTLRLASSARSAASIRQQFSNAVNVGLSAFGWQVLSSPGDWLAVPGPDGQPQAPALHLVRSGYLFLATSAAGAATLAANRAVQQAAGAAVQALAPGDLAARLPWLRTDDLQAASLGLDREGWFDGEAFARALAADARARGARWHRARVTGARRDGLRLAALWLDDGAELPADAVVLAAGAWSGAVGRSLGLPVPVVGRQRTVFMLDAPATPQALSPRDGLSPLVVDPSGVWFRSEGNGWLAGWSPGAGDDDPDDLPLDRPVLQQFEERVWPALAHRVPAFEALRVRSAWDGWYEVHPLDHNGLVGWHPGCPNLLLACGFSGHGLQHAPGVGRGVAELLLSGGYRSLDLSELSPARCAEGRAFTEQAII